MKSIFFSLSLFSSYAFAAFVDLQPGSSVRINSGETVDVRCLGQSVSNECYIKQTNIRERYDVYAGEALIKSSVSLESAAEIMNDLRAKRICR